MAFDGPEGDERPPPGLGRRHALTNQMLGFGLEVKPELLVEPALGVSGPNNRTGAGGEPFASRLSYPRGFAPRTPLHARSRAASPARSARVARSRSSLALWNEPS